MLSRLVNETIESRSLIGIKLGKDCPVLSHKLFVDDSLFFFTVNKDCEYVLKGIL